MGDYYDQDYGQDYNPDLDGDSIGGFDDQFDSGMLRLSLSSGRRTEPAMYPRSVSEMRSHTSYLGQGMAPDSDTAISGFMRQRPPTTSGHNLGPAGAKPWLWQN